MTVEPILDTPPTGPPGRTPRHYAPGVPFEQETAKATASVKAHVQSRANEKAKRLERNANVRALVQARLRAGEFPPNWAGIAREIGLGSATVRGLCADLMDRERAKRERRRT